MDQPDFLGFYLIFSFLLYDTTFHLFVMTLVSSWLWQFLRLFLLLMTLIAARSTGQTFCRMTLHWQWPDPFYQTRGFHQNRLDYEFGRGRPQTWNVIIPRVQTISMTYHPWGPDALLEAVFVRILHWNTTLSSPPTSSHFPYCTLWKKIALHNTYLRGGEFCSPPPPLLESLPS